MASGAQSTPRASLVYLRPEMKRLVLTALTLGIAALVAAGAYLLWSLDARVARAIEAKGTQIVGTRVRVDSVDIDLRAGRGTIRNVRVANPEGYSDADAITLAEIELAIDARSVGAQPFHITRARVGDSVVSFEVHADGGSNIEQITRHITGSDAEEPEPAPSGDPQRFAIGEFAFAGGEIFLARPGVEGTERVHMPGLEMSDLGGSRGATGGEIGEQIARAFTRRVVAATAGHQVGRAVEKELGEAAGDAAETILRHVLE
jgi:hypothetical protein